MAACSAEGAGLPLEAVSAVEVGEDAELAERDVFAFAAEGGGHAGEVADGCDDGSEASAEWFATGGSAEVVVAVAGAGGVVDDLDLPAASSELDDRLGADRLGVEGNGPAVDAHCVEVVEGERESLEVVAVEGGREVEAAGELFGARDDRGGTLVSRRYAAAPRSNLAKGSTVRGLGHLWPGSS